MRSVMLLVLSLVAGAFLGGAAGEASAQTTEVIVVDMDMEGLNRYSDNWQTAKDWATQVVAGERQEWLATHPDGRVVLLMHSGASFVGDELNQQGVRIDKAIYFSNGVIPDDFVTNLQAAGLNASNVLIVASTGDIQMSFLWPSNGYDDRAETGVDYSFMLINDSDANHTTMVTWADMTFDLKGTLPGLDPKTPVAGVPLDFIESFIGLTDQSPTLYIAIGGTNTDYSEGTAAGKLVDIAFQLAQEQAGAPIGTSEWWVQPSDWVVDWTPPETGGVGSGIGGGIESFPVYSSSSDTSVATLTSFHAEDFFPDVGLPGATTVTGIANEAETIGGSRARARDYLIDDAIHATVLGMETIDGPYAHSKVICDRFHGGELETIEVANFWNTSMVPGYWYLERIRVADRVEYSITFTVRFLAGRLAIECQYLPDYYPQPYPGEIVTYQIWAATAEEAAMILRGVLEKTADFAPVDFENLTDRIAPSVFARSARLAGGRLTLDMVNLGADHSLDLDGTKWRWSPTDAVAVSVPLNLPTGESSLVVDLGAVRGAMLHTVVDGFLDSVYVSVPEWFAFNDSASGGTSTIAFDIGPSDYVTPHPADDYYVFGNLRMSGYLDTTTLDWPYAGVGTQLEPRDRMADLSPYGYIQFWALGDGSDYRVQLETPSVLDNDYHGITFRAERDWHPYTISLGDLTQQGFGQPIPFDAGQTRSLIFLKLHTPGSYELNVSEIRFAPDGEWPLLFGDVPIGFWAAAHIYALVDGHIVSGYVQDDPDTAESEATYAPELPVTRDQMGVYVSRALAGGDSNVPEFAGMPTFPDVATDHWAFPYVEYAVAAEVVGGYEDGLYHPEAEVNRGQMAVFVARAKSWVGIEDDMTTALELFPDVPAGFWAGTAIEACVENDVVRGYDDGYYRPDVTVTRDQMAVYIQRAFELPM
ncbi:MAG: CIA30 family protein [Armatimonadetes bacterium]|nr:CIA30 family protein [Armatimonadota bacterium]